MMMETAKTLLEMSIRERRQFFATVADALEARASEAFSDGNIRFAANSMNLALAIRGNAVELSTTNLKAAEILLQQGINLVDQFQSDKAPSHTLH
jgi:hypothetical protein